MQLTPKFGRFPLLILCSNVELFVQLVTEDLKSIPYFSVNNNLNSQQRLAFKELQQMNDVVIKPADKGGNIVKWLVSIY